MTKLEPRKASTAPQRSGMLSPRKTQSRQTRPAKNDLPAKETSIKTKIIAIKSPASLAPRLSKKDTIIAMLRRPNGAALTELMQAAGWLEHSVRAFLTGLRKAGLDVARTKDDQGLSVYRIVSAA